MYQLTVMLDVPSYGLAIILMTIVIKLAMFPLTQKQMRSMRAMQDLQPKIKYLQEKYKNDPQLMQTKTMELYKENNASPLSGCLPLLIQMPIFIAFYQALFNFSFTNLAHASFLWIPNIGEPDPFFLIALLAALTTYLQQKLSMVTTKQDPTQRAMLYFMPVMMGLIAFRLPAGLPLYWVMFNLLGIAQQWYVNKTVTDDKAKALAKSKAEEEKASMEEKQRAEEEEESTTHEPGSGKGGKGKNGNPYGGKKGKKH